MLAGLGLGVVAPRPSPSTDDYAVASWRRLLMGVAGGCLYTPTIAYTFAAFPDALRGRAMGFAEAGVGAGQVSRCWGSRPSSSDRPHAGVPGLPAAALGSVSRWRSRLPHDPAGAPSRPRANPGSRARA